MSIPLYNKEDVIEKKDTEIIEEEKDIREQIIEFLKSKGYKHQEFIDDESDIFTNGEQLIQVVINEEIPDEILTQIESRKK